jgi:hypothetical protein
MIRGPLAVIAVIVVAIGMTLGVVIFKQEWSLAATALIGFAVVAGLTAIGGLLAIWLSPHGGSRGHAPPANPRVARRRA